MNQILATLPTLSMWFQCGATFKATFLYQAGFHVTDWIALNFDSLYQSAPNNDNTEEATAKISLDEKEEKMIKLLNEKLNE